MARHLFEVEDTFWIAGLGLVVVPGIVPIGDERFRIGDSLLLKRPDGREIATAIGGLEICTPNLRREGAILLNGLSKDDVPVGTEVWSAESTERKQNQPSS